MSAINYTAGRRFGVALFFSGAVMAAIVFSSCTIERRDTPMPETDSSDSLAVTISAPPVARTGDEVPITVTVQNMTERPLDLSLGGREITFDITVSREGKVVWQRLKNTSVPMILQLKVLHSNESFTLSDVWRAAVPSGDYVINAMIVTDAEPLRPPPVSITLH